MLHEEGVSRSAPLLAPFTVIAPLLAAILPVLIAAGIGYGWTRAGRPLDAMTLTLLVTDIGTPCLIVSTFAHRSVTSAAIAATAAASVTIVASSLILGAALLKLFRLRLQTYLPSVVFANTGNLGLPLALYAFGNRGLGFAIVFFTVASLANFTIGQGLAAGAVNWRALFRLPIIYGVIVGILVAVFRPALPLWLINTVSLLGNFTVPLMLLQLGASLGRLRVRALPRALLVAAMRLAIGAIVGFAVTWAFGLTGAARAVLIEQSAMPAAVFNYLFALRWNNDPEEIAGVVMVSTLAAIVTAPTLLYILMGG